MLEKQVASAQSRHLDFEDAILQVEREKTTLDRQVESLKSQLEDETSKRAKVEGAISAHKKEVAALKDRNVKLDRELNKALTDIKNLEWANKQLESKQDKTIVEHIHVLEEAKRVTDRQLAEAQVEMQKQATYIKSLEKAKKRLVGEAEDLAREQELEKLELQRRDKAVRVQEERASRALAELEKERQARETAELHARRLDSDLQKSRTQNEELNDQLFIVQRSRQNLETELTRLAEEADGPSMAKVQRQYEARISQLETQLQDSEMTNSTVARIKEHIERQHAAIRRLIMSDGPRDDNFRSRLLRELQLADEEMERELASRSGRGHSNDNDMHIIANVSPSKTGMNGTRARRASQADAPQASERQANALRQQLQVLEVQMATSDRVRQHLEMALHDLTADLDNSDGSKQYLEKTRSRLARENARLAELLEEEAEARRTTESAKMDGVQEMWKKFKATIANEQESYSRLEESRKALVRSLCCKDYEHH
jgi:myosin protein heavy chain